MTANQTTTTDAVEAGELVASFLVEAARQGWPRLLVAGFLLEPGESSHTALAWGVLDLAGTDPQNALRIARRLVAAVTTNTTKTEPKENR